MAKKMSVNKMDKIIKANKAQPKVVEFDIGEDEKVELTIDPNISMVNYMKMVNDIADAVFTDGVYAPAVFEFASGYFKLVYYTNITEAKNTEKIWEFLRSTDIECVVDTHVGNYYGQIEQAARQLIDFRVQEYMKQSKYDQVLDKLIGVMSKAEVVLDDAAANGIGGLDAEKLISLAGNLAGRDDMALVDAILDHHEQEQEK